MQGQPPGRSLIRKQKILAGKEQKAEARRQNRQIEKVPVSSGPFHSQANQSPVQPHERGATSSKVKDFCSFLCAATSPALFSNLTPTQAEEVEQEDHHCHDVRDAFIDKSQDAGTVNTQGMEVQQVGLLLITWHLGCVADRQHRCDTVHSLHNLTSRCARAGFC